MSELLSPLIGGVFTLLGIWLTNHLQNRPKAMQSATSVTEPQSIPTGNQSAPAIRFGPVLRDVGIIWILTGLVGFLIGIAMGGSDINRMVAVAGLGNIIFGTIGFIISGSLAKTNRWKHLFAVAIGVWLTSLINIFIIGVAFEQWLISFFLVMIMMAIGGLISYLFNR